MLRVLAVWTAAAAIAAAQPVTPGGVDGRTTNAQFGTSVAVRGERVLVGAARGSRPGATDGAGTAFLFERGGADGAWTLIAALAASDGAEGDLFGSAVALGDDVAFVGAREAREGDTERGALYVFEPVDGAWVETGKVTVPGALHLGAAVAAVDGGALVGAPLTDRSRGTVYVVEDAGGWAVSQRLIVPGRARNDLFGETVAADGRRAVVGARGDSDWRGAAYVVRRLRTGRWRIEQRLTPDDRERGAMFGTGVAIWRSRVVVGASRLQVRAPLRQGWVYTFERSGTGWAQTQILRPPPEVRDAAFGQTLGLYGPSLVVGALRDEAPGEDWSGTLFAYRLDGGLWAPRVVPRPTENGLPLRSLGSAIAVSERFVVAGARFTDVESFDNGSTVVYVRRDNAREAVPLVPIVEAPATAAASRAATGRASGVGHMWPNPSTGAARLTVAADGEPVRADVFDALGRRVATLLDRPVHGIETLVVDGLAPGRYVVRVRVGASTAVRPLAVAR